LLPCFELAPLFLQTLPNGLASLCLKLRLTPFCLPPALLEQSRAFAPQLLHMTFNCRFLLSQPLVLKLLSLSLV
jgi:hypothetical protein